MSSIGSFVKSFRNITRKDAGLNGDAQRIEQLAWMLFLKIYDDREREWECIERNFRSLLEPQYRWREWADTSNDKGLKGDDLLKFVDEKLFPYLKGLAIPSNTPKRQTYIKEIFQDIHNYMKDGVAFREVLALINEFDFSDSKEAHAFGTIYESILKELQSARSSGEFYTPRAITDFISSHVDLKIGDKIADFACGTGGFLNSAYKFLDKQYLKPSERDILNKSFFGIEKKPLPYLLCITNLLLNGIEEPNVEHDNSLVAKKMTDYGDKDSYDVILMNPPYGGAENELVLNNFPAALRSSETADLFIILMMYRLRKSGGRAAVIIPDGFLFGGDNKTFIKQELFNSFNVHTIVRLPKSIFAPYTGIATNIVFFNSDGPTKSTWFYRVDMPKGYKNFSKTKPVQSEHLSDLNSWWNDRKEIEIDGFYKAQECSLKDIEDSGYNLDSFCSYPQVVTEILSPNVLIEKYINKREEQQRIVDDTLSKILKIIEAK